jgi:O-antigen/teichoic acid export membrane protein
MSSSDSPIFIVGLSRGGTSLLSRMLDAHSNIAILPETWWYVVLDRLGCIEEFTDPWQTSLFFNEVWENLKSYRDPAARVVAGEASKQPRFVGPTVRVLEGLGQAYASERHASIWGEKTPGHALWLPEIRNLFPRARVLFMVRDPRDVLVSYDNRWNRGRRDTRYLISTAALLKFYLAHLLYRPVFPPEQVRWVKYESLTAQPSAELEQICGFLGVDFEPSMLAFYRQHENPEEMAEGRHHWLLSRPATTEHIGRYRQVFSPSQIALVERLLGEEMQALGYPLSNGSGRDFASYELRALGKAETYYRQMASGEIRKRLRRRGKLKLRAYQVFGRTLDLVPSWRVATTQRDWQTLAEQNGKPETSTVESAPEQSATRNALAGLEKLNFKTEMGRISRQSGIVFAGTIFTAVLGYLFKVYLARTLGAEALGIYALGMTVAGLVGVFGGLGLTWAASRFPATFLSTGRMEDLRAFIAWSVLILAGVNGALAACVVLTRHWVSINLYHTPALSGYLNLFALILFLGALTSFFAQLLTGYKEVAKRTIITSFAGVLLTILFAVILLTLGTGLWGYVFAQVASSLVVLALLVWTTYNFTPPAARFAMKAIRYPPREMFSFAAAAFAMDIMGFLYGQSDKIILGVYLNARSVGVYAVAATIVAFVPITLQSVNQIFSPTIAHLHARGEVELLNRLFQTLTKWAAGLTLPLAGVVIIFSRVLMRIFGHDFEAGWVILVIGAAGQLVNCSTGSVGFLLLMSGNEKRLVRIQLAMAVVTVTLCLILVPRWGIAGAAMAAAIANAGSNAWCLVEVKKILGLFPYNRSYWGLALPAAVALAATVGLRVGLRSVRADIAVVVFSTMLVYVLFVGTVLLSGLDADDRLIANAIWSRVRNWFPQARDV